MDNSIDPKVQEKKALRKALLDARANLPDRLHRAELLLRVMRVWLVGRTDTTIGAYWPIKGEFDPLPALHRWKEDHDFPYLVPRLPDGRGCLRNSQTHGHRAGHA